MIKKLYLYFVCICSSLIVIWPQIMLHQPNFLDVAETWAFGKNISTNLLVDFSSVERFRPFYVFHHTLMNVLFDYQPSLYFIGFAVLLSITAYLVIYPFLNGRYWFGNSIFILVLLYISPVTIDTYWRLGTAENLFAFVLLMSVVLLRKRQYVWGSVFICMLMACKETAVVYVPIYILYLYYQHRLREALIVSGIYSVFVFKIIALVLHATSPLAGYTSLVSFSSYSVIDLLLYYLKSNIFPFQLFIVSVGIYIISRTMKERITFMTEDGDHIFVVLCIFAGWLSLLFFHNKNQPYYFFPTFVTVLYYFSSTVTMLSIRRKVIVYLYIGLAFFLLGVPWQALERAVFWQHEYVGDGKLIELITNSQNDSSYSFDYEYRPELKVALETLTDNNKQIRKKLYRITATTHTSVNSSTLCGRLLGGSMYCKWTVFPVN